MKMCKVSEIPEKPSKVFIYKTRWGENIPVGVIKETKKRYIVGRTHKTNELIWEKDYYGAKYIIKPEYKWSIHEWKPDNYVVFAYVIPKADYPESYEWFHDYGR